jgi:hypothetical protein
MMTAIHGLALTTGANRVIKGARIDHVCGDPKLPPDEDFAYGLRIVGTAIRSLQTELSEPTLFDPAEQEQMVSAGDAS